MDPLLRHANLAKVLDVSTLMMGGERKRDVFPFEAHRLIYPTGKVECKISVLYAKFFQVPNTLPLLVHLLRVLSTLLVPPCHPSKLVHHQWSLILLSTIYQPIQYYHCRSLNQLLVPPSQLCHN